MHRMLWVVAAVLLLLPALSRAQRKTENVILVTLDGLRWQEVFTGAEEALLDTKNGGVTNVESTRHAFWRPTPEDRRSTLMPFLWSTIAQQGQIYGNRLKGSTGRVTNDQWFSYPGYNEILTGFADPNITSNDKIDNPNVSVLEWLHRKPAFAGKVAAFSGWDVTPYILNRKRCGFPVMGAWEPVPDQDPNDRQSLLNELIARTTPTVDGEMYDSFLYHAVEEHVKRHTPRVLFVEFSETDSWCHAGRYDRLLQTAYYSDVYIRKLWELVQSMDHYRNKTTLIITADHGRGSGPNLWKNHNKSTPGSDAIWLAALGPDTPALGERTGPNTDFTQSQIAATLAKLLGEDYPAAEPRAGKPISEVLRGN